MTQPVNLEIQVDTQQFRRDMKGYADQVPYATSKALNETIKDVQRAARKSLPKKFQFRRASSLKWAERGFKITNWASKRRLMAEMTVKHQGSNEEAFARFEEGGNVTAPTSAHRAIPLAVWKNRARTVPKSKKPSALQNAFVITSAGRRFLMAREGRRSKLIVAYVLKRTARLRAILGFRKTFKGVVGNRWERNWRQEWEKAKASKK